MTLTTAEVAVLVTAVAIAVLAAHAVAHLFVRMRQPAVIGEILAGLLFGPTVLGLLAPHVRETLFPPSGTIAEILAGLAELGLLLLMFITGAEIGGGTAPAERRTISLIAGTGVALPFASGLAVVALIDPRGLSGPAGSPATTALVFGIAVAVTSIPVISRIMLDLGILRHSFARVVLGVAAVEDVVLYGVLALVLSLAHASSADRFGLWTLLGAQSTALSVVYHVAASAVFFGVSLLWGRSALRWLLYGPASVLTRRSATAYRLAMLLLAVLLCTALGINPVFGALLAGLCVHRVDAGEADQARSAQRAWETISQFSLAFFIPIYFFTVGLNLDLVHQFNLAFFGWFFPMCCVLKAASVLVGAVLARQPVGRAVDYAVALNARGGPGIVLATVTLGAGVVSPSFYTSMVLLSVLTSQIAGFWLDRRLPHLTDRDDQRPPAEAVQLQPRPASPAPDDRVWKT